MQNIFKAVIKRYKLLAILGASSALLFCLGLVVAQLVIGKTIVETSEYGKTYHNASEEQKTIAMTTPVSESRMDEISNQYFSAEFNISSRTVTANRQASSIADFLNLPSDIVESLISSDSLAVYLDQYLPGKFTMDGDIIKMQNPFYSGKLLVQTDDDRLLKDGQYTHIAANYYSVKYQDATSTEEHYHQLQSKFSVKNVAVDTEVEVSDFINTKSNTSINSINDDYYSWGVWTMGLDLYTAAANIAGWGGTIKVAVLDTGIQRCHEVFTTISDTSASCTVASADRLDYTNVYDYVNDDGDPEDDQGHGTKVSALIVESTPENVKVIPIKVMNSQGRGSIITIIQAAADIASETDVINMSLGQSLSTIDSEDLAIYEEVFHTIQQSGAIAVAATGNGDENGVALEDVNYPASSEYVMAIGAASYDGTIGSFSNYGSAVDFAAPGVAMYVPKCYEDSSMEGTGALCGSLDGYQGGSGTSFATPLIAAAVAMIKLEDPDATYTDAYNTLKDNAVIPASEGNVEKSAYFGYGNVSFNNQKYATPTIVKLDVSQNEQDDMWTLSVGAVSNTYMAFYNITSDDVEPSAWYQYNDTYAYQIIHTSYQISTPGNYNYWIRDTNGNVSHAAFVVAEEDTSAATADVAFEVNVAERLSIATLDPSTEATISTFNLSATPNTGLSLKELLVRVNGNTPYQLLMSTASNDTDLTRSDEKAVISALSTGSSVDGADFPDNKWGYSNGEIIANPNNMSFYGVPGVSNPVTLTSGLFPSENSDNIITFGAKVNSRILSGGYTNTLVFTVLPTSWAGGPN